MPGVKGDVLADEARYEVVAVVVTGLVTERYGITGITGCRFEKLWFELLFQKSVSVTLIDEHG